ncbi:hypothetical protein COCON_G00215080 [Conger conger]|uniref:Uncharacterized protein n=1 Tax=Conger conger TaxID=82655 RepID=A0A9Q1CXL4_CONCO|nr:17-beta-hydroxysteroid dehydrogenase 14-like [Conger conger]KAJ8252196.1 hypothetical protein COCON_G00215080 [Conger conger]
MSNSARVVLVLGGAGTVGSGIVKALLDRGSRVVVVSRDSNRLENLKSFVTPSSKGNLITLEGNVGSEEDVERVKQATVAAAGKLTDVVSSLGFSWWQGGLPHTQTLKELQSVVDTRLLSTFVSWKAFFPLIMDNPGSTYTFITGGASDRLLKPGTGFLTVGAACALAFCQIVRDEYPDVACKFNQVVINTGVAPPDRMAPGFLSHLDMGEAVAALVERQSPSHKVVTVQFPADLKAIQEGNI